MHVTCCDAFSSSSVVSRAFSALCVYSTLGHHPHPLGYLYAKFHFFRCFHCWASPWRKIAYSLTHSITHSLNHPAYLMHREPKLLLRNSLVILSTYLLISVVAHLEFLWPKQHNGHHVGNQWLVLHPITNMCIGLQNYVVNPSIFKRRAGGYLPLSLSYPSISPIALMLERVAALREATAPGLAHHPFEFHPPR